MADFHITAANSVDAAGDAFNQTGPGTLIVDAGAYLLSESSGAGAHLTGLWTVTIDGEVGHLDNSGSGLVAVPTMATDQLTLTIGSTGELFGVDALFSPEDLTLLNEGTVRGAEHAIEASGETHITNIGTFVGDILIGFKTVHDDTFTDFKKVGTVIKNGIVRGEIDLGAGNDHFHGGTNAETVHDDEGDDVYTLGGGNDTYLAVPFSLAPAGTNSVHGGSGMDTFFADGAIGSVDVNLDTKVHGVLEADSATGAEVGTNTITNFENAIGGDGDDVLVGSGAANKLTGGLGADVFDSLGGRDILTGGAGADIFTFITLSDSGATASTRDSITDFSVLAGDRINLIPIDANSGVAGNQAFHLTGHHGLDSFTHNSGELREVYSHGNTIVMGDVNGDSQVDFSIVLTGYVSLHDTDFLL